MHTDRLRFKGWHGDVAELREAWNTIHAHIDYKRIEFQLQWHLSENMLAGMVVQH
jgi:hypothetical protein